MRSTPDWETDGVEKGCKSEPEEAAYEHADSKIELQFLPSVDIFVVRIALLLRWHQLRAHANLGCRRTKPCKMGYSAAGT
jgi:hypothetical protein